MISDAEANIVYISDLLEPKYRVLVNRLRGILGDHGIPLKVIRGTNDIWCRDYMPVQVGPGRFVKFRYAPDYLVGFENTITDFDQIESIREIEHCEESAIVVDGGNVVRWNKRVIMTEKVFSENPGVGRDELTEMLRGLLRVGDVIVIPQEADDVIGHADGMVRFLDAKTVFVNDYSEVAPSFGRRLSSVLRRARLNRIDLPYCPVNEEADGIPSAVGCYANFLMVRGLIVLPTFGMPEDETAYQVVVERARHQTIETIDCSKLARNGGVLNCMTFSLVTGQPDDQFPIHKENYRE